MNWNDILSLGWVSKHYGTNPSNGIKYSTGKHAGTDIVLKNDNIPSFTNGTVYKTGYDADGWGNYAVVKNDDGFYTIYAHMNKTAVQAGQRVKNGSIIGIQGQTGQATGKHLHLEVRSNYRDKNSTVAPNNYFRSDGIVKNMDTTIENTTKSINAAGGFLPWIRNNFIRLLFIITGIFLLYVAITRGIFGDRG